MIFDTYYSLFNNSIFLLLFFSMLFYWISLAFNTFELTYNIAKVSSITANLVLFFFLSSRWVYYGYFPLSNLYESLLFLSCILIFVHQVLESRTQSKLFGSIISPIVLLITSFANLTLPLEMQKASALVPALQSNWLMMHVSLMMLSYATLIIGSLLSILFLLLLGSFFDLNKNTEIRLLEEKLPNIFEENFANYQALDSTITYNDFVQDASESREIHSNLRHSYLSVMFSIHKIIILLKNLDNWSYRIISLGFPFLTIGIISGAIWANEAWGSYWSWDPKETWALITWLVFAAYLHVRLIKGWQGRKPAFLASLGFFVVWICYLGVNFLGQGLHSYGWLAA